MTEGKIRIVAFLVQSVATLCIANLTILTGYVYAWPSYNVANFLSNDTILSRPMTSIDVSFLGSLANIGALASTPLCAYMLNKLGRKYTCMLFGVPYVIAWSLISLTSYVPLVIVAMGLAGIGAGGQAASSIYIAEIAQDSIRGALTSSVVTGYFLGLLLSYSWGGVLGYDYVIYLHLSLSVMYIVMLAALKESPVFLLQCGKEEEAAKSIAFYRHVEITDKEVEVEMGKIKASLDPHIEQLFEDEVDPTVSKELISSIAKNVDVCEQNSTSEWQFLKNSESSFRALTSALVIMTYTVLMGIIVLQVYAEPLFKEAVPSMEPNQCSIFLAVDFIVPCLLCGGIVDKLGRRYLMIATTFGCAVSLIFLATQLQLHWAPHWFTAVLIYVFCFCYNMGPGPIPFIITAEFFLPEVRGLCNSLVNACAWIMNFVTLFIFSLLVELVGLAPLFYAFSVIAASGAVFCMFYLPETKGLPVDAIQLLFLKKRSRDDNA